MFKIKKIYKVLALCLSCMLLAFPATAEEDNSSSDGAGIGESQQAVTVSSIRINNVGAKIEVFMAAAPGETASVSLFAPGTTLPTAGSDYATFMDGVEYANMIVFDESGEFSFTYTAEETGLYTLRTRGALCQYVCTGNDVSEEKSEKMYFESWVEDASAYTHEDFHALIKLDLKTLSAFGTEVTAKSIKSKTDERPEGRKNLFIANDLLPFKWAENYVYWETGVQKTKAYLDEFFAEYYAMGGKLDMIFTDAEQTPGMWHLGNYANANGISTDEILADISSDARYAELENQLVEAGYDTAEDGGIPLSSVFKTLNSNNYHYFNNLMQRRTAKYLNDAVYAPAIKYFPNVKYCEYGFSSDKQWTGNMSNLHKNYLGGNQVKAGTHSSPVLYGGRSYFIEKRFENIGVESYAMKTPNTHFGEVMGAVINLRVVAESEKNAKIMPWISVSGNEDFISSGYYHEKLFHTGMHGPDPFMFFGPKSDPTPAMEALSELNSLVAYKDRKSLNTEQIILGSDKLPGAGAEMPGYWVSSKTPLVNAKYLLSGMYAGGRNIWRITPDTNYVPRSEFLISQSPLKFKAGDTTIEFPQGEIIDMGEGALGVGYWVTTPEGVMPEITYDDETQAFAAVIEFRSVETGNVPQNAAEKFDAVVTYKGLFADDVKFIMAQYDESGKLVKTEIKECGTFAKEGHSAIFEVENINNIKFFLWEGTKPLTEVR